MRIQQHYDQWAASYDSDENKTRDLDQLVTQETLSQFQFEQVLELGCGTGKNTAWLQTHCQSIVAVDFSPQMMAVAKTKITSKNIEFLQKDINRPWKFEPSSFDLITCNLILEHIEDIDFIFQQSAFTVKNNGFFFISEYHPFRQYLGKQARFDQGNGEVLIPGFTHPISEFLEAGKKNGFTLVELKEWKDKDGADEVPRLSLIHI